MRKRQWAQVTVSKQYREHAFCKRHQRLRTAPFRPRAEVSFPRARQFSEYNNKKKKKKKKKLNKWAKLREEFNLEDKQLSEAFVMPLRVANEPYLRSFQYKVLNSILYTNELLWKIGYTSNPNCSFCHQTTETMSHIFFDCTFSTSFWNEICDKILNKLNSCRSLSLEYREIILGYLTEEMNLLNYILI